MKKIIIPVLKFAINKAKQSKFIKSIFEAPFEINKFETFAVFTDSFGNKYELLNGLRSKIKPGWENMFVEKQTISVTPTYLNVLNENGKIAADNLNSILKSTGKKIVGSTILEIGCNTGTTCFAIEQLGAHSVTGTEYAGYKVESINAKTKNYSNELNEVNSVLKNVRTKLSEHYKSKGNVTFIEDDICKTTLNKDTYDIICSWDVLEHLHTPALSFKSVFDILKEDGVVVHHYNPFFALNGGHSPCTLDMLWGHARLNKADFEKYLEEIRPSEKDKALSFYEYGLNRMTLHDLKKDVENSGLEIISIIPITKEQHIKMLDDTMLKQVQKHYPTLTIVDLVSPSIYLIAKKPKKIT